MKWVPLTNMILEQLRQRGYTHLVVKNITEKETVDSDKEFVTLEAVSKPIPDKDLTFDIGSDATREMARSREADYYVLFR